ncbi:FMN binding protein [Aureococcus anophagefferens]|nr:FMN binding protein [Aureococcus anophagefferens]
MDALGLVYAARFGPGRLGVTVALAARRRRPRRRRHGAREPALNHGVRRTDELIAVNGKVIVECTSEEDLRELERRDRAGRAPSNSRSSRARTATAATALPSPAKFNARPPRAPSIPSKRGAATAARAPQPTALQARAPRRAPPRAAAAAAAAKAAKRGASSPGGRARLETSEAAVDAFLGHHLDWRWDVGAVYQRDGPCPRVELRIQPPKLAALRRFWQQQFNGTRDRVVVVSRHSGTYLGNRMFSMARAFIHTAMKHKLPYRFEGVPNFLLDDAARGPGHQNAFYKDMECFWLPQTSCAAPRGPENALGEGECARRRALGLAEGDELDLRSYYVHRRRSGGACGASRGR